MGIFDKARQLLGLGATREDDEDDDALPPPAPAVADARGERLAKARGRKDRPPLEDIPPEQGQTIEDALAAREAGDRPGARKILATIDRGGGLRTVLRAAAALEDGDEPELRPLLPLVAAEAAGWRLILQVAAALGEGPAAARLVDAATAEKAPAWALAWTRAMAADDAARREGLVELLFADAPLARTVAARDLAIPGAVADSTAATRYAAFAHGRDSIRRFGAPAVAELVERAVRA
jgi:hypothetical protein